MSVETDEKYEIISPEGKVVGLNLSLEIAVRMMTTPRALAPLGFRMRKKPEGK